MTLYGLVFEQSSNIQITSYRMLTHELYSLILVSQIVIETIRKYTNLAFVNNINIHYQDFWTKSDLNFFIYKLFTWEKNVESGIIATRSI